MAKSPALLREISAVAAVSVRIYGKLNLPFLNPETKFRGHNKSIRYLLLAIFLP